MLTELRETDFPAVYTRFSELFPDKPWVNITTNLQSQIKANPLSQDMIQNDYLIAFGLSHFEHGGMALIDTDTWKSVQHAMGFAAQVTYLLGRAQNEKGRKANLGRIWGAFSNPVDMRALRFEHLMAMNLHKRGVQIDWPEEAGEGETFDILASAVGAGPFEVECKSCAADKGRPIKESEAAEFLNRLKDRVHSIVASNEVLALKIRIPKRLPTSHKALDVLADEVVGALLAGKDKTDAGELLTSAKIEVPEGVTDPEILTRLVHGLAAYTWGDLSGSRAYVISEGSSSGFCIEVCSAQDPKIFKAMWETAKHAVQTQMTKTRPGCLVLRLEGMTTEQLLKLSQEVPNNLALFAEKVLTDERHKHLACLAYVGGERDVQLSDLEATGQCASYVFSNPAGHYPNLGLKSFFLGN